MSERYEFLDRRVLGAVRMVDVVTQQPIPRALHVFSDTMQFVRNHLGFDVISRAAGLEDYGAVFNVDEPPFAAPAPQSFTGWVEDVEREYMVREFSISLPRSTTPPAAGAQPGANSVFAPVNVELLPAQGVRAGASWAILRIRALRGPGEAPFPGLLVRATNAGADARWGMTDADGEAVVGVAGLPRFRTGPNAAQPITDRTTLELTFMAMPAAPAPPTASYSHKGVSVAGFFHDWRDAADNFGPALDVQEVRPGAAPAGQALATEVTPGREARLTVRVTP